jgi:hypothetical protein
VSYDPWGIYKNGTFYRFPEPLKSMRIEDSWDMDEQKAVLADGEQLTGLSRNGVRVTISGCSQISNGETPECASRNQFVTYAAFRSAMDVSNDDKFELFLFHQTMPSTEFYRKFKRCVPAECSVAMGDDNRIELPYSLSFRCEDSTIYSTPGGS